MKMTLDDVKKLTMWMRDQGVVHFAHEGLTVQFHPRALSLPGAEVAQPKQPEPQEKEHASLLERMIPR